MLDTSFTLAKALLRDSASTTRKVPTMGQYGLTIQDYSKEESTLRVNTISINAATITAQEALALTFRTAAAILSIGAFRAERLIAYNNDLAGAPASTVYAQRENKWLITYEDTTSHKLYKCELPCADLSLLATNSDEIDYSNADVTAFIVAFEAFVVSPTGGASNVLTIKFVGRNL